MKMKKKHSMAYGYIMIVMMIIIYMAMTSNKKFTPASTFNGVMELLDEYPEDPYTLMDIYNKLSLCLYGGAILDEEIEPVLIKQRLLYSEEILELNPFGGHLEKTVEEIDYYRELKLYITTINIEEIDYDKSDKNICFVTVRQHTNSLSNSSTVYILALRDDVWKIIGWEIIRKEVAE